MKISESLRIIYHKLKFQFNFASFNEYQYSPIDIYQPLPISADRKLKKLIEELSNFPNLKIRISDGTLLGILRDRKLIPHDNDIDFDIEWSEEAEKVIQSIAKRNSWKNIRKVTYYGKLQQLTYFDEEKVIFDFIFWSTDERFAINFSEPGHFRIMESKFLINLVNKEVENFSYLVPFN